MGTVLTQKDVHINKFELKLEDMISNRKSKPIPTLFPFWGWKILAGWSSKGSLFFFFLTGSVGCFAILASPQISRIPNYES